MKYLIFSISLALSACTTTVPVKQKFPESVPELMKQCKELYQVEPGKNSITDLLKTVINNYVLYHECSNRVDGWRDWYNEQKIIFNR